MQNPTRPTEITASAPPAEASTDAVGGNHLALQRAALNQFLRLTRDTAEPDHAHLEREHTSARRSVAESYARVLERLTEKFRKTSDKAQHEHAGHLLYVREQYGEQIATIQAEYERRCRRTQDETEAALRDAHKTMEQDAWLAESVSDATREQIKREREKLQQREPELHHRLEEIEHRARWLLEQLGYRHDVADSSSQSAQPLTGSAGEIEALYERGIEQLEALETLHHRPMFSAIAARMMPARARKQMDAVALPLRRTLADAARSIQLYLEAERMRLDQLEAKALYRRETETHRAREIQHQAIGELQTRRTTGLTRLEETLTHATRDLVQLRDAELSRLDADHAARRLKSTQVHDRRVNWLTARRDRELARLDTRHQAERDRLEGAWREAIALLGRLGRESAELIRRAPDWEAVYWQDYRPTTEFVTTIRLGSFELDLSRLAPCVLERTGFDPATLRALSAGAGAVHAPVGAKSVRIPAVLELPQCSSLLIQTAQQGRPEAITALQAIMARLLTSLPPGRAHFTIIDPVGLGENFAGFMHLADYDEALVNGRIWTDKQHIEQRLSDLTAHMENVIQKYLRNEFDSIDAYNVQAGELAEPYRFLVIADFPANFTEEAVRRLNSIVASGPRCGVYTLITHDTRLMLPFGIQMEDVQRTGVCIRSEEDRFVWQDSVLRKFPLTLDTPPDQDTLTALLHKVGQAAGRAKRVEVPFEFITPPADQPWTASAADEIRVPVGRTGAVRLQELRLGRGVAQHCLIAGKTGSGKSTLLHVLITNLVLWYPPDEVEFYLIDFKKGVEFKTYATHLLPHARAIAIESDREFGVSVLHRLEGEMDRRGEMFRTAGVQDLPSYRVATGRKLPRTLLIVDEFQVFFSEEDKLGQDAAILLDRLVRQGRAFGIHVILGSQTLGGTSGLPRSTIGQMAIRIALQCSEIDSQLIFEDGNSAARLLTRPGEAIYNDAGGLLQGNSPFQTAWLSDEQRDVYLDQVSAQWQQRGATGEPLPALAPPVVFEGNAPADLRRNHLLMDLIVPSSRDARMPAGATRGPASPPRFFLGEAVAIKDPTSAILRRQSGAHLLIIGQRDDAALGIMACGMIGLSVQHRPTAAQFIILDGSSTDSPHMLQHVASVLPERAHFVDYRLVAETLGELVSDMHRRQSEPDPDASSVYVLIYGLQRYRMLRRSEEFSFSSGSSDENAPLAADKLLTEILREGPAVGIHVIAWADTPATVERMFDRQTVREFDNRVLFQMSASDSSNLIDSPIANRLGFYRALFFSEEQGLLEKFRPYTLPDRALLDELRLHLSRPS